MTLKLVLLSGGSGKRLWPMSNDIRSKQFLRVLPGADSGTLESMLQRVWHQLHQNGLKMDAYVCASKAQSEIIEAQIGDVPIIEEPARRDTFAAIAMSTLYLIDIVGIPLEEPIAICPVDHFVDDHYFREIQTLGDVLTASSAQIALMGVEPSSPTSKFGYIVPEDHSHTGDVLHVKAFVEKPDTPYAEELLRAGAFWNCGVFCFRAGTLLGILKDRGLPTRYQDAVSSFESFPKRSFDYEVVEQMTSVIVHPYRGTWTDLGTWSTLSEQMASDAVGQAIAYQSEDTHIINELGIPVVTMGLKHAVVVATPDGILAADKHVSMELKELVGPLQNRPMYEERMWGTYRVLDYQKLDDGTEVLTKSIDLYAGKNISYHKHLMRSEVWTVIDGSGEVVLGRDKVQIRPGDVVRIDADKWHAIRTFTGLKFIEVQRGTELTEEDIARRHLTWSDLEKALQDSM